VDDEWKNWECFNFSRKGSGRKLGDVKVFKVNIEENGMNSLEVKNLQKALFFWKKPELVNEMKDILKFNGFPTDLEASVKPLLKTNFDHWFTLKELRALCVLFNLKKGGLKDDVIDGFLTFLFRPGEGPLNKRKPNKGGGKKDSKTPKTKKTQEKKNEAETKETKERAETKETKERAETKEAKEQEEKEREKEAKRIKLMDLIRRGDERRKREEEEIKRLKKEIEMDNIQP